MQQKIKKLGKRILDISYRHKLSHLSSCLTSLPIIFEIYNKKKDDEIFVLSNGHAGLALYVVLEHFYGINAEMLLNKHGIHPSYDPENKIYCSTGSLGSGLPIAVGYALSDKNKNVYCLISDGECAEGSIWESLRFVNNAKIRNIKIYANINGYSATNQLDASLLYQQLKLSLNSIDVRATTNPDFAKGVEGHYKVLTLKEYEKILCQIDKK